MPTRWSAATCVAMLFSVPITYNTGDEAFYFLVLTYNFLAFGLQPMFGRLTDRWQAPRWSAIVGCGLIAASVFGYYFSPTFSICLAGIENGLFHVGGGTVSLNLTPDQASAPSLLRGPWRTWACRGDSHGKGRVISPVGSCDGAWDLLLRDVSAENCSDRLQSSIPGMCFSLFRIAFLLLFASIFIRSLIGMGVEFSWKTNIPLLAILTLSVAAGKAIGGILADRYGWVSVSTTALVTSAPLIAFASNAPYVGILGMFLFNMTMAVTLVAIARMFPGRPGFAFGLPCLALLLRALPAFTEFKSFLTDQWFVLFIILGSAGVLFAGLRLLPNLGGISS